MVTPTTEPRDLRRRPWVAVALSLLCPGVGHVYCGRLVTGLAVFGTASLLSAGAAAFVVARPSDGLLGLFCATIVASAALVAGSAAHAARVARSGAAGPLREFQRPAVYVLLLAPGLLCTVGSAAALQGRFLRAYVIATGSMEPTLRKGDRVLVNEIRLAIRPVERGDVVAFREPASGQTWIKRVVGLPGDTVEIARGDLLVNGRDLYLAGGEPGGDRAERWDGRRWRVTGSSAPLAPVVVPDGHVWVLGDHRDASNDSREIGPVPLDRVIGPAEYVYWPGTGGRFGVIGEKE